MKENKQLQNLLLNYATEKVEEQKNWKIENEIFDLARPILIAKKDTKEAELLGKISLEDLLEIKKQLQESVHKTEHHLIAMADTIKPLQRKALKPKISGMERVASFLILKR